MSDSNASSIRGLVKVNDEPIQGWIDFEVESNTYASSDSFRVRFAANALPADRSVAWFSQQQDMYVELFAGVPADPTNWTTTELPSWIYGQVDNINHDPVSGIVEVSGRDLARMLIDAKTTEKFQNKTSSQIASLLAARHGLTPQVTKTSTLVGKYYAIDHDAMNNARTEWDLLCYLARIEQFVVYVRGKTLYYQPRPDPTKTTPYRITFTPPDAHNGSPTCNVEGLKFSRTLTVSRGVYVHVRSFNDVDQRVYTATYPTSASKRSTAPGSVGNSSDAQTYFYSVPNLTQQQCVRMAQAKYQDIVRHEMRAEFEVPAAGNDDLDTTSIIEISGTGTAYDQLYYPESITRELSFPDGYRMTVHAKNHAPDSLAQG
ncbi:hypothetical protein DIE14_23140 [Burkholderia sp. Bp9017]|uniref:hypothetical protein n=1 Tax=unclassified Burkholderia TaxID=2613784 RepID=UPI000F5EFFF9|nr:MULTISPECIES: hypothetical protein [unclassified Burkholderia]RQZ24054.1 hypothetical protein DIE14_23140 [Burkholderia sp. Bp9017]RQZ31994.1 hypothetical protein DIE13_23010 [Burkholderia sp. Bp9016]